MTELTMLAQATIDTTVLAQGMMVGFGFLGPAIGIGLIGGSYMQAVGRNPEASKFLGQALIFTALAELFGLIAFASIFIIG